MISNKFKYVLVLFVLVGCSPICEIADLMYSDMIRTELYYSEDFSNLICYEDICDYLDNTVEYEVVPDDETLTIEEFLTSGKGDCLYYSLAFLDIAYIQLNEKCSVVFVNASRSVVNGGLVNHAVVQLPDGRLLEPQNGSIVNYEVDYIYSFDEIFY